MILQVGIRKLFINNTLGASHQNSYNTFYFYVKLSFLQKILIQTHAQNRYYKRCLTKINIMDLIFIYLQINAI